MTDVPIPRFDPQRLRDERRDVDLGEEETGFARGTDAPDDREKPAQQDEPTAGMTPPAR